MELYNVLVEKEKIEKGKWSWNDAYICFVVFYVAVYDKNIL